MIKACRVNLIDEERAVYTKLYGVLAWDLVCNQLRSIYFGDSNTMWDFWVIPLWPNRKSFK